MISNLALKEIAQLQAEVAELREAASIAYQFCAARGGNEKLLDNLVALSEGDPLPHKDWPIESGTWTWEKCGHTSYTVCGECLTVAKARIAQLEDMLLRLTKEASGFLSTADPERHGNTNINVMLHWIAESHHVLHSSDSSEWLKERDAKIRRECVAECLERERGFYERGWREGAEAMRSLISTEIGGNDEKAALTDATKILRLIANAIAELIASKSIPEPPKNGKP